MEKRAGYAVLQAFHLLLRHAAHFVYQHSIVGARTLPRLERLVEEPGIGLVAFEELTLGAVPVVWRRARQFAGGCSVHGAIFHKLSVVMRLRTPESPCPENGIPPIWGYGK